MEWWKKTIKIAFCVIFTINYICCTVYLIVLELEINGSNCTPKDWDKDIRLKEIFNVYVTYRIVVGSTVDLVLIVATVFSIYMLKNYFRHSFHAKITQMIVMLVIFCFGYLAWTAI